MLLVVAFLLIAMSGRSSTPASEENFLVAILTPGAILPIAAFAKGEWTAVWTDSYGDIDAPLPGVADVPVGWLGQPIPEHWTAWRNPSGEESLRVNGLERQGCEGPAYILVTPTRFAPRGAVDTMHIGLATAPARRTLGIARDSTAQPPASVRAAITRAVLSLGGISPVLQWLIRPVGSDRNVRFFETRERGLGSLKHPGIGIVEGWLQLNGAHVKILDAQFEGCGNEEMATLPCIIPIGVIPFDDHEVWVMERPTGETNSFQMWRVDDHSARPILGFDAGGC
jgi:hypothetical protein